MKLKNFRKILILHSFNISSSLYCEEKTIFENRNKKQDEKIT